MADEMNTEHDMPEGITRDDTAHGETYYTAADMATASAQGFRGGVASLSAAEPANGLVTVPEVPTPSPQAAQQAPAGATSTTAEQRRLIGVIADKIEDGSLFQSGIYSKKDLARFVRNMLGTTPQAAPAAPSTPASGGWISVDERLPEVGVTVLVYEPFRHGEDWPDTVRIFFDYICPDYEDWHDHCASHEHFMAVGGANACGPDVTCIGPSEKAPYTHWMPLPDVPASPTIEGESNV